MSLKKGSDGTRPEPLSSATASAHPSLAMVKYWGKADPVRNIPAVPSLALTLDGLQTVTEAAVVPAEGRNPSDRVFIDGVEQPPDRYVPFFSSLRALNAEAVSRGTGTPFPFSIIARSSSDFPSAAGLASSASGFAALAAASSSALGITAGPEKLSSVARVGSASAARSLFGGFVRLDAGSEEARPVRDADWWPSLRVLVVQTASRPKPVSSRSAMESSRTTSPYYGAWLRDAPELMEQGIRALELRSLDDLGPVMRLSYMRMFSTMFSSDPPILYWSPASLEVIRSCEEMRRDGLAAWETMDAGPQVKIFCLEESVSDIRTFLSERLKDVKYRVARPGGPARIIDSVTPDTPPEDPPQ